MGHVDYAFERVHMPGVLLIPRHIRGGQPGENVPRQARNRFATVAQQAVDLANLFCRVIAYLGVSHELQFGILKIEFVHDIDRVVQIAADAVADDTQFHFAPSR